MYIQLLLLALEDLILVVSLKVGDRKRLKGLFTTIRKFVERVVNASGFKIKVI